MATRLKPTPSNPLYTAALIKRDTGKRYTLKSGDSEGFNATTDIRLQEPKDGLAQCVTITLANVKHEGSWLSGTFDTLDRVFVYADTGDKSDEVFRGFVWDKKYDSNSKKLITLICYDNLIYFQKSEDSLYFSAGKSTESVCQEMFSKWGVELSFKYRSIPHKKMPINGKLADLLLDDILGEVKKQTGAKYVVKSIKDVTHINEVGQNEPVYTINRLENAISTSSRKTMDDVITKVIITGKEDDDEKLPISATLTGNTERYGTIQKVLSASDEEKLEEIKKEGQELLDENGEPKVTYEIEAVDIPWVRKGDKINVSAGDMVDSYIVLSTDHNPQTKKMKLDVELYKDKTATSGPAGDTGAEKVINLSNAPIYVSSDAKSVAARVTGTYYLYDGKEILGRYRITNSKERCGKTPVGQNVTGWIDKSYVT